VITTHSPYILTAFNTLIEAQRAAKKTGKRDKVAAIVPEHNWVSEDDFAAYAIQNHVAASIFKKAAKGIEGSGLIDGEYWTTSPIALPTSSRVSWRSSLPTQPKLSDCTETLTHTRIKVDDKRSLRWAVFLNPAQTTIRKVRVDGCLVSGSIAADWIVSKADCADVVVELKGRDVGHAIQQIVGDASILVQTCGV
jgi:hypothetical protein